MIITATAKRELHRVLLDLAVTVAVGVEVVPPTEVEANAAVAISGFKEVATHPQSYFLPSLRVNFKEKANGVLT